MKSARFSGCLLGLVAVVGAVAQAAAADTTLRWKFTPGQKLGYVLIQKTDMKMEVQGKKVGTTFSQTMDMTWEIKGTDKDGTAEMVQTIDRVRFESTAPDGKQVEMDTADAQDAPGTPEAMTKMFRAMAGSQFTMKVTPRGDIRDFQVPAKIVDAFKNAGPAAAMFGSEESLKNMAGQSLVPFPETAVAPGKSWKGERKLPMPFGTMLMDMTYTLEDATGPVENIGIDVKVQIEPKDGSPIEIKLTSEDMKGHYRFDNTAGILKSSDVVQNISMTVKVGEQEIAQDLTSTVKMDLKK